MLDSARTREPSVEPLSLEARIRRRAYERYIARGDKSGSQLDDWLQAEVEIREAQERANDEADEESFPASDSPDFNEILRGAAADTMAVRE